MKTQHFSRNNTPAHKIAQGLGWFSIGLGLAEMLAPRFFTRALSMGGQEKLVQAYGLRELAAGVGLLAAKKNPAPWVWARVGGDAIDIATLAAKGSPRKLGTQIALGAVAGVTAVDVACAKALDAHRAQSKNMRDYSDRSGFPLGAAMSQGVARDFSVPRDMRIPDAMRPKNNARPGGGPDHGGAVYNS